MAEAYALALFQSIHGVLAAESLLNQATVPHRIIAVPRHISSNCGFCIRFDPKDHVLLIQTLQPNDVGLDRIVLP